jgi:hypothetical protein
MASSIRDRLYKNKSVYGDYQSDINRVDMQSWGGSHPVLPYCVQKLRPEVVIEVGTWKGVSSIAMANKMKECGIDGEILCVDTWLGSPEHWLWDNNEWFESLKLTNGYPNLYDTFINNVVVNSCENYITPVPLPSDTAYCVLKELGVKAKLIFIDAGHEYENVSRDLINYWEFLTDDGVIVLDDYNSWAGVTKAALEFAAKKEIFIWSEFGRAVLAKNNNFTIRSSLVYD